jgi:uncharacterized protein YkwD
MRSETKWYSTVTRAGVVGGLVLASLLVLPMLSPVIARADAATPPQTLIDPVAEEAPEGVADTPIQAQNDFPAALTFRVYISNVTKLSAPAAPPVSGLSFADRVVELTNAERAKVGCAALIVNNTLATVAQNHAVDMGQNDYFSHTSLDGRSPFDRMRAAGYRYTAAAENIAAGYQTPESVVAGWMNSSGHRTNILNCNYTQTGVGYFLENPDSGSVNYYHYWVQNFGRP